MTLAERAALYRFSKILNSRYGISDKLSLARVAPEDPAVFLVKFPQPDFSVYGGVNSFAAGCSGQKLGALFSAAGEAIERYAGFLPRPDEILFGSHLELSIDRDLIGPDELPLFRKDQFQRKDFQLSPFLITTRLAWLKAQSLHTLGEKWFPADGILAVKDPGIEHIDRPTTSGLAAGSSLESALENALFELIERDAVMLTWWQRRTQRRIHWQKLISETDFKVYQNLAPFVEVIDIQSDLGAPAAMAIYRGKNAERTPALLIAASAAGTYRSAILKALSELSHLLIRSRSSFEARQKAATKNDPYELRDFLDHVLYYHRDEHQQKAQFLWASPQTVELCDIEVQASIGLSQLMTNLRSRGYEAWSIDLTPRDLASIGFKVVRVLVPGLVGLNAEHQYRYLGNPRLGQNLNLDPHPFP